MRPDGHLRLQSAEKLGERVLLGMQQATQAELTRINWGLDVLASIGSSSPFIGLFGTVWGIMNAFRALGMAQQATLAQVAPGIAEALIATAMGLFAAIPAVLAYNAARIVLEAQSRRGGGQSLKQAILAQRRFEGLFGLIEFDDFGEIELRTYITTVKDGRYVVVK